MAFPCAKPLRVKVSMIDVASESSDVNLPLGQTGGLRCSRKEEEAGQLRPKRIQEKDSLRPTGPEAEASLSMN